MSFKFINTVTLEILNNQAVCEFVKPFFNPVRYKNSCSIGGNLDYGPVLSSSGSSFPVNNSLDIFFPNSYDI